MDSKTLNKILKSNPLAVLMVLEGLNRYSSEVAASSPADYLDRWLIKPDVWIQLGKDIQAQLND